MQVWHLTPETLRTPYHLNAGEGATLWIGTYPIEPGHTVWVDVRVCSTDGKERHDHVKAHWLQNEGTNSYWEAEIGPFADADRVLYSVRGRKQAEEVSVSPAEFTVGPKIHIAPRVVFTASEVLTKERRQCITQAWGHQPFNVYGATESATIAAECDQHRGLHLVEDLVITEVVDEHNCPVPPGVYGEKVLITVLCSQTQPLIRYEMSDSVQLATSPCPCGRPYALIDTIQGRVEDVLHFPAVTGGWVAVHPNVFHEVLDLLPVSGWQVAQQAGGLKVLLSGVQDGVSDEALTDALRRALGAQGAITPPVKVERITVIPRGAVGKAALIKSELQWASDLSSKSGL